MMGTTCQFKEGERYNLIVGSGQGSVSYGEHVYTGEGRIDTFVFASPCESDIFDDMSMFVVNANNVERVSLPFIRVKSFSFRTVHSSRESGLHSELREKWEDSAA
jgi:hypothetical protein